MRILVINPNTTESVTVDISESGRRHAPPTPEVDAFSAPGGPQSIGTHVEDALASAATVVDRARGGCYE